MQTRARGKEEAFVKFVIFYQLERCWFLGGVFTSRFDWVIVRDAKLFFARLMMNIDNISIPM